MTSVSFRFDHFPSFDIIPDEYATLANIWGIRHPYGPYMAFAASVALVFSIIWLGLLLSFGRLVERKVVEGKENVKKALLLLSLGIAIFSTYGLAEFIVYAFANLLYGAVALVSFLVIISIVRALWAGVSAAGATTAEARKLEFEAKAELEKARRKYEEEAYMRAIAFKRLTEALNTTAEQVKMLLDEILKALDEIRKQPDGNYFINYYSAYCNNLERLKEKLEKAKGRPSDVYAVLDEALYLLSEIAGTSDFIDKLDRVKKGIKNTILEIIPKLKNTLRKVESKEEKKESKEEKKPEIPKDPKYDYYL